MTIDTKKEIEKELIKEFIVLFLDAAKRGKNKGGLKTTDILILTNKASKHLMLFAEKREKEVIEKAQIGLLRNLDYKPYKLPDTFQAGVEYVKKTVHERLDNYLANMSLPIKEENQK